jgi:hypothetical protein
MRTTAAQRGPQRYTTEAAVEKLAALEGIHGVLGRERAIRIIAIAQAFSVKAEALRKGMVTVRPAGSMLTIEIDS